MSARRRFRDHVPAAIGWILLGGGALLAALALVQNLTGQPFRVTLDMRPDDLDERIRDGMPHRGFEFRIPAHLRVPDRWSHLVGVTEDGRDLPRLGKSHGETLRRGGGRYLLKGRRLVLTVPDGSDARVNGRDYRVSLPYQFRTRNILLFGAAALAGAALLAATRTGRASAATMRRGLPGFARRIDAFLSRWFSPYLAVWLAVPSILVLSSYPPFWKDDDALVQLLAPPCSTTLLHFSWFYSMLARLPGFVLDWVLSVFGVVAFPGWRFWEPLPGFSPRHAYALLLAQHAALWFLLAGIIRGARVSASAQLVLVLVAVMWTPFFTFAQVMGTEAGAMLFSLLVVVVSLDLLRGITPGRLVLYAVAVFGAAACRHIYAMLAMALPLAMAAGAWRDGGTGRSLGRRVLVVLRGAALVCLAGVAGIGLNSLAKSGLCAAYGIEKRSTVGRVAGSRETLLRLPGDEKEAIVRRVSARLPDDTSRAALDALAWRGQYWDGGAAALGRWIHERTGLTGDALEAASDHAFRRATLALLAEMPSPLWREIRADCRRVFFEFDVAAFAEAPLGRHQKVERILDGTSPEVGTRALVAGMAGNPAGDYDHILPDPLPVRAYLGLWTGLTAVHLLGVAVVLLGCVLWRHRRLPANTGLALALLLTSSLIMLTTNVIICFFDRYALPVFTLYPVVLMLLLADCLTPRPRHASR